jgi:hypothetical protein
VNLRNPFASNPFASNPFASNPFTSDPFASNPFASDPFASNPFAKDPFAKDPFAKNPFASNPFDMQCESGQYKTKLQHTDCCSILVAAFVRQIKAKPKGGSIKLSPGDFLAVSDHLRETDLEIWGWLHCSISSTTGANSSHTKVGDAFKNGLRSIKLDCSHVTKGLIDDTLARSYQHHTITPFTQRFSPRRTLPGENLSSAHSSRREGMSLTVSPTLPLAS